MPIPISRSLRIAVTVILVLLAELPPAPSPASAQVSEPTRKLGPCNIPVFGIFLAEWSKQGSEAASVYVNGYPITPLHLEISLEDGKLYNTQWFERARYEAHPEKTAPYDVLLGRLGASLVEGRSKTDPATGTALYATDRPFISIDLPADANGKTKLWFPETRHTLSGKILEYWQRYGGLAQFGFPLSEPFDEISPTDGKTYTVQYFERNRFELHPNELPPYDVELGLLGVQQSHLQAVPADQLPIAPPPGVISSKDTLVQASQQEPTDLIAFETNTQVAQRIADAITFQDRLVHGDNKGNYFPLATWYVPTLENGGSYFVGTGDDRRLVTKYKLRPGIKWADGAEITSNDAIFGYSYLLRDPNITDSTPIKKLSSVDNPDKYTIIYNWMSAREAASKYNDPKTDKADYVFLEKYVKANALVTDKAYFDIARVLPQQQLGKIRPDRVTESDYARNPMGYGPYRIQEWKQGQQMTLVVNENYTLTAPPLLKTIVEKFIVDINQNVSQFQTNNLDAIAGDYTVVPPEQSPQIVAAGGIITTVPANSWELLRFYMDYPPFQDKRVRQAIFQAIDRTAISNIVYKGAAQVQNGPTPPNVYFSLENPLFAREFPDLAQKYKLPIYPYDPNDANHLLDDAGWLLGLDGIRQKDGHKLQFAYSTTRNPTRQAIQALVHDDLTKVGIDTIVTNCPVWFGICQNQGTNPARNPMVESASQQTTFSDYDAFSMDELPLTPETNSLNSFLYKNPVVTAANRQFYFSTDRHATAEAAAIAQVEIMNDIAIIPLVERPNIEIYKTALQNRKVTNSEVSQWWNITQWYFK